MFLLGLEMYKHLAEVAVKVVSGVMNPTLAAVAMSILNVVLASRIPNWCVTNPATAESILSEPALEEFFDALQEDVERCLAEARPCQIQSPETYHPQPSGVAQATAPLPSRRSRVSLAEDPSARTSFGRALSRSSSSASVYHDAVEWDYDSRVGLHSTAASPSCRQVCRWCCSAARCTLSVSRTPFAAMLCFGSASFCIWPDGWQGGTEDLQPVLLFLFSAGALL
ncbi:unnamed protein product, partial [Polarella glacialis]